MFYKLTTSIYRTKMNGVENRFNANLVGMHYRYYIRRKTHGSATRSKTLLGKIKDGHKQGGDARLRDLTSSAIFAATPL